MVGQGLLLMRDNPGSQKVRILNHYLPTENILRIDRLLQVVAQKACGWGAGSMMRHVNMKCKHVKFVSPKIVTRDKISVVWELASSYSDVISRLKLG